MKCDKEKMIATLAELGFINNSGDEFTGFYKTYKFFRLWIATKNDDINNNWFASITVGQKEISIPLNVNEFWVYGFNEENSGY